MFEWCSISLQTITSPGPQWRVAVGVGDEVEALGRVAHEEALAPVARVDERRNLVARRLVGLGRLGGDRVDAAVHVGVVVLVDVVHRVQHLARRLRRGRGVQVGERVAVDLAREDREVGAQSARVERARGVADGSAGVPFTQAVYAA